MNDLLFNKMVDNNLNGKELEKSGDIESAIKLYEQNIGYRFQGSFPYDRLSTIYRKRKQYDEEVRVLKIAVDVFTNDVPDTRPDKIKKLEKYKNWLERAEKHLGR